MIKRRDLEVDNQKKEILLTEEGFKKIEDELELLKTVRRKEVAERIKVAISFGDISENSEYDEAKNEQAQLEERILKLENILRVAVIIDESSIDTNLVTVGSVVKIEFKDALTDEVEEDEYTIVGSAEADPSESKISNESPIGKALLGKVVGDEIDVQVPDGISKIKILEIRR
ncbi:MULTISPECIES: transcription elongation factor GreA [Acetoanaerobium]|jgi:transcription elongation factor GreA|uniref:transcription elongation factor GreA n=1 Tax=Acetoanaerobium TaxID=186831 RepID=UPI0009A7BB7A|nr:transcription elongation factor GreA [Acetoanaerobium noterae]MBP8763671.1 transcription elongation factor GreA [Acetoanaerobium sp.]MBP9500184.1 transcription elongation factor GreA [Acetoanaerobium sp.]MBP9562535.1 transcription elongation factor GreA [Acetoanaerobium sp.]MDK2804758.1 transcription elongation factor GreA [Peptostreptococcaceae bacterium]